jgi:hypothetical protein
MCVPLRHLNRLVPHQLGNRQQIDSSHRESAGERVPQTVPGEISKASFLDGRIKPVFVSRRGFPCMLTKTCPPPVSDRFRSTLNAATATALRRMCRAFPVFVFGRLTKLRLRSTRDQSSPYYSLGLMPV